MNNNSFHQLTRIASYVRGMPPLCKKIRPTRNQKKLIKKACLKSNVFFSYAKFSPILAANGDMGWPAGFFDGDGCISIARQQLKNPKFGSKYRYDLVIHITQNCLSTLEAFQSKLNKGGHITATKRFPNQKRQCYVLSYCNREAIAVLDALYPYLVRKQQEAQLAFDFFADKLINKHRKSAWNSQAVQARMHDYYMAMKIIK